MGAILALKKYSVKLAGDPGGTMVTAEQVSSERAVEVVERTWARWARRVFGGVGEMDAVVTRVHVDASPEAVWRAVQFYEEVPGRPPLLLRLLLPAPLRTRGDKKSVGGQVECIYDDGWLMKRMTGLEKPWSVRFEVLEQRLGIEACAVSVRGSYEMTSQGDGVEIALMTQYETWLHPRWVWRRLETVVVRSLHKHVLRGVKTVMERQA